MQAGVDPLVQRVGGGVQPSDERDAGKGHLDQAQRGQTSQQLPRAHPSQRRRPCGGQHLHLQRAGGRRGPHQQLDGSRTNEGNLRPFVLWLHEGAHDVCCAVLNGAAGLADRAHRRRAD